MAVLLRKPSVLKYQQRCHKPHLQLCKYNLQGYGLASIATKSRSFLPNRNRIRARETLADIAKEELLRVVVCSA